MTKINYAIDTTFVVEYDNKKRILTLKILFYEIRVVHKKNLSNFIEVVNSSTLF